MHCFRRGGYHPPALSSYEKGAWGFRLWTGREIVSPCGATYFDRVGSSVQTAYPSSRPGGQVSLIPLYLLSKLNPLCWASVWYRLRAGELFRLWASSFCSGAKGTKRPPGAAHGHLQCPIPPRPGPPFNLRGNHQGARLYPSGAGKGQDTAPYAARCAAVGGFAALRMRRTPCGCCRSVLAG